MIDDPFALVDETVLGERMQVFARRPPHLRVVLERSAAFGDADYLVFGDRRIGYRAHLDAVASVARALAERYGVRPGDRVAIAAANCPEWIVTFWAAVSLGAIPAGLNAWWAGDELRAAVEDCQPQVLLADARRLDRLGATAVPVIAVERDFAALWNAHANAALPTTPLAEDDAAAILYTSGTTGTAKGVVHTHRNILALSMLQLFHGRRMQQALARAPGPEPRSILVANPLFHVSGLYTQVVTFLALGAKTVWTVGAFDPTRVLQLIEDERITGWSPHGSMAPRVVDHPELARYDRSSVQNIGSGGAPVPPALQARLGEAFPGARDTLTVGYGLTECTALACINWGAELAAHPDSVGRALPTVEIEVRGTDGVPVAPGAEGEIHIRGPLVMKEYWRRPEATRAAILPGRWLRSGDIGRIVDGRVYIDSRQRDLILRNAENIHPNEIELRLAAHPAVDEAAVIGVPHPQLGQEVKAIVVPRAGARVSVEELAAWVGRTLAYFKVPAHWELRAAPLPRNAAGKVLKRALGAMTLT